MRSSWRVTLAAAVVLAAFGSTEGAIRFVSASAPAGGDGQTWATACKYLQDALTAARVPGSGITEIWVAAGTYQPDRDAAHPTGTGDRNATFSLITDVAIRGGFAGNEDPATFDLATRDFVGNKTTLSGDLGGNDGPNYANYGENSLHVTTGSGTAAGAILDGVTICGGNANGTSGSGAGGGMYNSSGSPTLLDCIFVANTAFGSGQGGGAGMYNTSGSTPRLERCAFIRNSATTVGYGGGILNAGTAPTLNQCSFVENIAYAGAGIHNNSVTGTLSGCIFSRNTGSWGTGLASYNGNITVVNCTFRQNASIALYAMSGAARVANCSFCANDMGIRCDSTSLTVVNSILWGNKAYQLMPLYATSVVTDSCIQGGWLPGQRIINADPRFLCPAAGDLGLRRGSPCIDAGRNSEVPQQITTDLSGEPRFMDDPETLDTGVPNTSGDPVVDLGAYEYAPTLPERLYVDANATSGGDGSNWTSAFRYLQDALSATAARAGVVEIWVAGGVYQPDRSAAHVDGTADRSASFQLPGGVAIYGGFPGLPGQEGDPSVCDPVLFPTVLSGDLAENDGPGSSNNDENSYHVTDASGTGASTVLDGFIIAAGNANAAAPHNSGGGVYALGGSPTLRNCRILRNAASGNGGGVYTTYSPTLVGCIVAGNSAAAGGALYKDDIRGAPVVNSCTFVGNSGVPGGIYCYSASDSGGATVSNCVLWANTGEQLVQHTGAGVVTYSCIQGGWIGDGNISVDPKLVLILGDDLRLRKGSPCIDAGSNGRVPVGVTTDAGGAARFVDDPDTMDTGVGGSQAGVVDMGALEYQPGPAKRLYVDAGAAGGDGLTQATAFAHLQDAFKLAQADPNVTEIWVGAGGYRPDRDAAHPAGTGDRTATFSAPGAVRIYGGFTAGTETAWDLADRDPSANPTVLSGDLAGNDGLNFANNAENSYHVVDASWTTAATVLDGLILSGGNANGTSAAGYGGGMYIASGGPTVNNCTLTANAAGSGGGLYNASTGTPVLTQCRFTANRATSGGGMWNASSAASVMSCTFSGNSATSSGGGLFNSGSAIKLVNGVFTGNSASSGGGVYSNGGSPAVVNSTLFGNSAASAGGGFFGMRATPTLTGCILWGNTAPSAAQISGAATTTYSCVQGGATGQGNTSLDPLFANAAAGDLRLSAASPCIDAGSNAAVPSGTLFDAAGRVRFMDIPGIADCPYASGTCGTAPIVDMGAYEFIPAITGDFDTDGDVDEADLSKLAACALGPGMGLSEGCELRRLDADEDIDLDDFGILQRCYSGYARAADANCGN